jgi:hypothetical protein
MGKLSGENGPLWLADLNKLLRQPKPSSGETSKRSRKKQPRHIIDCDAAPFVPAGLKLKSHQPGGKFTWDSSQVKLHLSSNQTGGQVIQGHNLYEELKTLPVFNANLLDFSLKHPELIPEDWKGKAIFFWGTIYSDGGGGLCVRCLDWDGEQWFGSCHWLDDYFRGRNPAAVRAR